MIAPRKVWLIAQMVKDELEGNGYLLNEVVAVYASQAGAEGEAKKMAAIGGTYSIFEHEVRTAILM